MSSETETVHLSADGVPIVVGGRFWDNNLRVVTITEVGRRESRPYADTGEYQTWHGTTGGISDTMSGSMQSCGRLTKRFEGKCADDYPDGTSYSDISKITVVDPAAMRLRIVEHDCDEAGRPTVLIEDRNTPSWWAYVGTLTGPGTWEWCYLMPEDHPAITDGVRARLNEAVAGDPLNPEKRA